MKLIPLTQGHTAVIDDEDYNLIAKYKWHVQPKRGTFYAISQEKRPNGKKTTVRMHRLIMGAPSDKLVDHINRNGLDNTRKNLRLATTSQNSINTVATKRNKCGIRGVYFCKTKQKWCAHARMHGKLHNLGLFTTQDMAAVAYRSHVKKHYGEFAPA